MSKIKPFTECVNLVGSAVKSYDGTKLYVSTGALDCDHIDFSQTEEVSFKDKPSRANLCAESGDILFAKMQGTKKTLVLDAETSNYIYSTGFVAVRPKENIISRRCLYHLVTSTDFLQQKDKNCSGATQKAITNKGLERIMISVPDIAVQPKIANKLDRLDTAIQLCNKILERLNDIVKSRFIELFGDLVRNPMNWDEQLLGAVCAKVIRYPTFYGMEYLDTGTKVIRIGNILADGRMDPDDKNYVFVYDTVNDDFPETIIEMNDIIMAVRGDGSAAKRIGIITEPGLVGANISPNLIRIKVDPDKLNPIYMFYYLTGEVGQKRLNAYVNKTAKKNIAAKDIVKVVVPVPPIDQQQVFAKFVADVDKSKLAVTKCLKKAEYLKAALMQQYFG